MRRTTTILATAALALGACGDESEEGDANAESAAAPDAVLADVGVMQAGVANAAHDYAAGDEDKAAQTVVETVVERFESVEESLEAADPELAERLDEQPRATARGDRVRRARGRGRRPRAHDRLRPA